MIFPCLCNHPSHRECLRAYTIITRKINCEKCKATYAINGITSKSLLAKNTRKLRFKFMKIGLFILLIALLALIIGLLDNSINNDILNENEIQMKTIIIIILSCITFFLLLIVAFIVWINFFSERINDIMIFCKQTEIANHGENPEKIFKSFIQNEDLKQNSKKFKEAKQLFENFDLIYYENCLKNRAKISGSIFNYISYI